MIGIYKNGYYPLQFSKISTNIDIQFFDSSLSESIQQMTEWRHSRYGLSAPKPFSQKIGRALQIFLKNKLKFFLLLAGYLFAEILGNAALLIFQWTVNQDSPKTNYQVLIQLTASLPVRIFHAILNMVILYVLMNAIKRKGHTILLSDLTAVLKIFSPKLFISMVFSDIVLSSPLTVAQTLVQKDIVLALIYLVFAFFLNWLFGLAQFLLIEDHNIPLITAHIWSASAALQPSTFSSVALSSIAVFAGTPLIFLTPILLVLQLLTFYEIFGYASPAEVHLATEEN